MTPNERLRTTIGELARTVAGGEPAWTTEHVHDAAGGVLTVRLACGGHAWSLGSREAPLEVAEARILAVLYRALLLDAVSALVVRTDDGRLVRGHVAAAERFEARLTAPRARPTDPSPAA